MASARTTVAVFGITAVIVCFFVHLTEQRVMREFNQVQAASAATSARVHELERRLVQAEERAGVAYIRSGSGK